MDKQAVESQENSTKYSERFVTMQADYDATIKQTKDTYEEKLKSLEQANKRQEQELVRMNHQDRVCIRAFVVALLGQVGGRTSCTPGSGGRTQKFHQRSVVVSPKILGGKNFGGSKMFDFRRATLFCVRYRLSKHKMTRYSKNLGAMGLSLAMPVHQRTPAKNAHRVHKM